MPIEFLWGDEDYLIEKEINKIKTQVLKEDINELNYKVVDNPSFGLFSELLRTNALMFGDVVIVIKCSKYFLEAKQKEKLDDKQTQELIEAFNNISNQVHIILTCQTPRGEKKKPDARKKLYKELIKITTPKEFPSYKSWEEYKLIPIVKKMAQEIDLNINNPECSLLIQTTGTSLRDISTQLEKIKLYLHPQKLVTKQSIQQSASSSFDIYNLVDLVLEKNYIEAVKLLTNIFQKEHFLPILGFVQTAFTNLLKTKIYSKQINSFEIAQKLNQNEFIVKKNIEKVSKVPLEELVRLKINLSKAEFDLKTGILKDPICAFELAFFAKGAE